MPRSLHFAALLFSLALAGEAGMPAQGHGGGPAGGPGGASGMGNGPGGGMMGNNPLNRPVGVGRDVPMNSFASRQSLPSRNYGPSRALHAIVQVGPPYRWWDDKSFARSIGIADDQRKRMDAIFNQNKGPLSASFAHLQHEENTLNKLVKAKHLDEEKIMAQIDIAAQARVDLEKNATHMMLELRRELNDDQLSRLESRMRQMQPPPSDQAPPNVPPADVTIPDPQ